jgi:hypothetical protein
MAAAAATLAIAPVADAAREPWQAAPEYGAPRPRPEPKGPTALDVIYTGWLANAGVLNPANSWASRKPGTVVTYTASDAKGTRLSATLTLVKVTDALVTFTFTPAGRAAEERNLSRTKGITDDAKLGEEKKETIEIDGTKYACVVKTYDMPGRVFTVWECPDAPFGFVKAVSGEESTVLIRAKETLKTTGGEFACSVWAAESERVTQKLWRSDQAPGLVVRVVETARGAAAATTYDLNSVTEGK